MAAVESRELVSAVRSFAHPNAPRPMGLTPEREQKAEQQLERARIIEEDDDDKCTGHLTRDAASQKAASGSITVAATPPQFNKPLVSFSVR
jgi:hypothetical protein